MGAICASQVSAGIIFIQYAPADSMEPLRFGRLIVVRWRQADIYLAAAAAAAASAVQTKLNLYFYILAHLLTA